MNEVDLNAIPGRDKAMESVQATKSGADFHIAMAAAAVVCGLGALIADIWYSVGPALGYINEYFAWIFAVITTPLQFVIFWKMTDKERRKDLTTVVMWYMVALLCVSLIYDVGSNFSGLYDEFIAHGAPDTDATLWMALFGAVVLANIEYFVVISLQMLQVHLGVRERATEWITARKRKHEKDVERMEREAQSTRKPPTSTRRQ